jgi:hypothetical protein
MSSSPRCVFLIKMSEIICTYPINNIWRKLNHIEDQRLQKDDKVKEASMNKANKQSRDPKNQMDRRSRSNGFPSLRGGIDWWRSTNDPKI